MTTSATIAMTMIRISMGEPYPAGAPGRFVNTWPVLDSARARDVLRRARSVPAGFVTTYGDLCPEAPRFAGAVMAGCHDPEVPWQRVVRAACSKRRGSRSRGSGWTCGSPGSRSTMPPSSRGSSRAPALLALAVAAFALGACGGGDEQDGDAAAGRDALPERTDATLVLDFVPNAVHTGIYCALASGYFEENNLELEVIEPTSTSDTLKLIGQGRAAFGIADGIDVGQQIDRGLGAKAIMALVQRPLGGVITLEEAGIRSPAELEGRTVGVTGVPSDEAVLDTVVSDDGGDPGEVDEVTIGFNTVPALQGGRVDAITGFPPADGTALELRGEAVRSFRLDEWGGPRYPGLVVFSTRETIERDPALMRAFVDATVRGYEAPLADPP